MMEKQCCWTAIFILYFFSSVGSKTDVRLPWCVKYIALALPCFCASFKWMSKSVIKRCTLCQHLCFLLLCTCTIFDFSWWTKVTFVHQNRHEFIKCISQSLFFFLSFFLFFPVCRNIGSILFAFVVSSGLKSFDRVCLFLTLFCKIWKWIKVGEKAFVSNNLLTDKIKEVF